MSDLIEGRTPLMGCKRCGGEFVGIHDPAACSATLLRRIAEAIRSEPGDAALGIERLAQTFEATL